MNWQFADAKNRFSEVVRRALNGTPQRVAAGAGTVVIVDAEQFDRLTGDKQSFVEFLTGGPNLGELHLERDEEPPRGSEL